MHVCHSLLLFSLAIRQTFALELKNEENVMNAPYFTIQCALLYSTSYGERRIRVHTIQVWNQHMEKNLDVEFFSHSFENKIYNCLCIFCGIHRDTRVNAFIFIFVLFVMTLFVG